MNKYPLFMISLITMPIIAQAALPPAAESMRRIKAVMDSKAVFEALGTTNVITSVNTEKDGYTIHTDKCTLKVTIDAIQLKDKVKKKLIGPPILKVNPGKLECTK